MSEILNKAAETAASAIMRFKAKTAGRYYPGYHEDMRDAVKKAILAERASLSSELDRLQEALKRQSDNMAFVINHISMPEHWYEKFQRELEEDRAALSPDNSTQKKEG